MGSFDLWGHALKKEPSTGQLATFIIIGIIFAAVAISNVLGVFSSEATGILYETNKNSVTTVVRWKDPARFYFDELAALTPMAILLLAVLARPVGTFWRQFRALPGPEDRRPNPLPKDEPTEAVVSAPKSEPSRPKASVTKRPQI